MTGKDLLKLLEGHGWKLDRVKGSHHMMSKGELRVVVPVHGSRDLQKGTVSAILKQAGLK